MMSKLSEVLDFIEAADERELKMILQSYGVGVRRMQADKARQLRGTLKKGDTVVFKSIKPKYLIGVQAEVLEVLPGDKARVDMGRPIRRYGRIVTAPFSTMSKVG